MFTKSKAEIVHRQNDSVPVLFKRKIINENALNKGTTKRTTPAAGLPLPAVAPLTLSFEK